MVEATTGTADSPPAPDHGDPERDGRHGDDGLKIGRETMQPIFDFIDGATRSGNAFPLVPMLPHQPHNPPERLLKRYRGLAPTLEVARYWAMCSWFDETCGQLLDDLDARKIADDTIVIFLADNGWIQDPAADGMLPNPKAIALRRRTARRSFYGGPARSGLEHPNGSPVRSIYSRRS